MLFQTTEFLALFLIVLTWIALIRKARTQHGLLLLASYVFYGWWDVRFLLLIVLSTTIDFAAALGISGRRLTIPQRAALSALLAASTILFLVPDWPALQGGAGWGSWSQALAGGWTGRGLALSAGLVFAIAGPVLYGLYFRLNEQARRRAFLITSVAANLLVLSFFKYFNFFTANLAGLGDLAGMSIDAPIMHIALPVGISFYTFQTMSYTIDCYRGDTPPEQSFTRFALYVAYFPQLVAGPILRPSQFLPFLDTPWRLESRNVLSGANLVLVGLVKKVLIADNVAPFADQVFNAPDGQPTLAIWLATAMFAVQIYCDFSGYTDIARGISRIFGIEIPINFNFPYFATSIIDFWRRWHISLSTWLRDYLYVPLGGSRVSTGRLYLNLMITMVLGGLWHGAAWNFVLWGAYQGALLCANRLVRGWFTDAAAAARFLTSPVGVAFRWAITAYLWMLGWLIFRVTDPDDLIYCIRGFVMFDGRLDLSSLGLGRGDPIVALLAAGAFVVLHSFGFASRRWDERLTSMPIPLVAGVYFVIGLLMFYAWPAGEAPFIYFQF